MTKSSSEDNFLSGRPYALHSAKAVTVRVIGSLCLGIWSAYVVVTEPPPFNGSTPALILFAILAVLSFFSIGRDVGAYSMLNKIRDVVTRASNLSDVQRVIGQR